MGYKNVKVYRGSFLDWVKRGGSIEKDKWFVYFCSKNSPKCTLETNKLLAIFKHYQ